MKKVTSIHSLKFKQILKEGYKDNMRRGNTLRSKIDNVNMYPEKVIHVQN